MAAITVTTETVARKGKSPLYILYGKGADNSADTLTAAVPGAKAMKLMWSSIAYDGTATQAGVTWTINSFAGTDYDVLLSTGSANAEENLYLPDGEVWLHPGDSVDATAPAGGAGVGAACMVVLSEE